MTDSKNRNQERSEQQTNEESLFFGLEKEFLALRFYPDEFKKPPTLDRGVPITSDLTSRISNNHSSPTISSESTLISSSISTDDALKNLNKSSFFLSRTVKKEKEKQEATQEATVHAAMLKMFKWDRQAKLNENAFKVLQFYSTASLEMAVHPGNEKKFKELMEDLRRYSEGTRNMQIRKVLNLLDKHSSVKESNGENCRYARALQTLQWVINKEYPPIKQPAPQSREELRTGHQNSTLRLLKTYKDSLPSIKEDEPSNSVLKM